MYTFYVSTFVSVSSMRVHAYIGFVVDTKKKTSIRRVCLYFFSRSNIGPTRPFTDARRS